MCFVTSFSKLPTANSPTTTIEAMADRANAAYLALWRTSAYSNLVMMQYIVEKKYPSAEQPWRLFLEDCDATIPPRDQDHDRWTASNKVIAYKKTKLFGNNQPIWDDKIPEHLWAGGNGLCTSFAIAVDKELAFEANLVVYNSHRAAHKIDSGDKSVIVLDSAVKHAFELPNSAKEAD
ncbi:hypothetical protein OPT61_g2604 [Boeremia exigua]|uniref:Uncharacterized protein n=1 Tax=Boeremia exigua TaxID=749465 RepID=A0ACC2IL38_9PLEO|nr:hypothetical protein OPT61_g2604 [Boeremia exigua]